MTTVGFVLHRFPQNQIIKEIRSRSVCSAGTVQTVDVFFNETLLLFSVPQMREEL